jgi:secondary thiamine-phosphate synthase enzyme
MIHQSEIELETRGEGQMHDITTEVAGIVRESSVSAGLVHIFNIGSTGSIGTVEFEPGLVEDVPMILNRLMPPSTDYGHERTWHDGNGHSHLQATLLGPELTVPVRAGEPVLGTWQQIFHIDCDNKARRRRVMVTVMGE